MSKEPLNVNAMVAAIELAFVGLSPGVITLHEAEAIDGYATEPERKKARTRDLESDWRQVPEASLIECPNALPHLDPIAWRFYLPAFMRLALRTMKRSQSPVDQVIYALALHDDQQLNDYQRQRFTTLDADQARAVLAFLELASADDDHCDALVARQAIEKYWRRVAQA